MKVKVVEIKGIEEGKDREMPIKGLYEDMDLEVQQKPISMMKSSSSSRIKNQKLRK